MVSYYIDYVKELDAPEKPNTRKIRNPPPRLQEERVSRTKKSKPVTPSLVTLLRDHEIYDDISYFRKVSYSMLYNINCVV